MYSSHRSKFWNIYRERHGNISVQYCNFSNIEQLTEFNEHLTDFKQLTELNEQLTEFD